MIKMSPYLAAFLLFCLDGTATADAANALSNSDNACINIVTLLTGNDCSHSATRYPGAGMGWQGPMLTAAYYPYNSITPDEQNFIPAPGDGKLSVPLAWSLDIQGNGTPSDGTDDVISGTFSFGAADHWVQTGNGDFALERWTAWNHTLAPTTVSFATALPGGGFEYIIGARGKPTPLVSSADPEDGFASENAPPPLGDPSFWSPDAANLPIAQRIGIERSPGFGNTDNTGGTSLQPNVGAQTTASLVDYECLDGDDDCTTSPFLTGSSLVSGTNVTLSPGFTNLIMVLTVGPDGNLVNGEAYWTREFIIRNGPAIGDDPVNPGLWVTPNSWVGGRFTLSAVPLPSAAWFIAPIFGLLIPRMKRRLPGTAV